MNKKNLLHTRIGLGLLVVLLMSACSSKNADVTPTFSVELAQTLAVATYSAALTQTSLAMPSNTPSPTPSPSPTDSVTIAASTTAGTSPVPGAGIVPTSSCYSMAYVSDVTIPDNTSMTPGQTFTKTWRVRNNGTCAWDAGFKFTFTGGNVLGSSTQTLNKAVSPGTETELSVAMTAPGTAGNYRSNWRMATAAGANFGDEVYVIIVVNGNATATSTGVPAQTTSTSTMTGTATDVPTETGSQ